MELEHSKRERDARERELRERELREMEMKERLKAELEMKTPGKNNELLVILHCNPVYVIIDYIYLYILCWLTDIITALSVFTFSSEL